MAKLPPIAGLIGHSSWEARGTAVGFWGWAGEGRHDLRRPDGGAVRILSNPLKELPLLRRDAEVYVTPRFPARADHAEVVRLCRMLGLRIVEAPPETA